MVSQLSDQNQQRCAVPGRDHAGSTKNGAAMQAAPIGVFPTTDELPEKATSRAGAYVQAALLTDFPADLD